MSAKEEAIALKVKGNKAFASHDWPTAIDLYTQAIEKYDQDPSFFCNRAQVFYNMITLFGSNAVLTHDTGEYQARGVWICCCRCDCCCKIRS